MTVDIVGYKCIGCFSFSGEFLLNSSQLGEWDDSVIKGSVIKDSSPKYV